MIKDGEGGGPPRSSGDVHHMNCSSSSSSSSSTTTTVGGGGGGGLWNCNSRYSHMIISATFLMVFGGCELLWGMYDHRGAGVWDKGATNVNPMVGGRAGRGGKQEKKKRRKKTKTKQKKKGRRNLS
jgi:hypothetical protein